MNTENEIYCTTLQQAFNIRIKDSGTEDGDMNPFTLPKETFGLQIPQVLSETEKVSMKNAINSYMVPRFSVSSPYLQELYMKTECPDIVLERVH